MRVLFVALAISCTLVSRSRRLKWTAYTTMLGDLGERTVAEVTREGAFSPIESYAYIPVQAQILRRKMSAARGYCHDAGKLPEAVPNWWCAILRGKLKSKGKAINSQRNGEKMRVLSAKEAGELIPWLPNFSRDVEDFLMLYFWTCTREAEIGAMEAKEVSVEADGLWWTVPKEKNAKREDATDFRVPLVGRAEQIVKRRLAANPSGYLFPSYGKSGHWEQKSVQTRVYYHQPYSATSPHRSRARLTVTHWAPHDLRRTSRTFLASLGCPREVGEVILGHMLPGVEGVYNRHTYDKERRLWLKRLSVYLEKLVKTGG